MQSINSIFSSGLKMSVISVYLYLERRADKEGKCLPSIRTMARELNVSESTIRRSLRDLEKNGYIRKEQRFRENKGNTSNMYFLEE